MADELRERYGELLTGSYDCVDRIVLNAYYPLGYNPGGFRVWWRRWHEDSDEQLDNAHLMRLAGRFARRVRAWAEAHQVPVIDCTAGERKHLIAEEYLREHTVGVDLPHGGRRPGHQDQEHAYRIPRQEARARHERFTGTLWRADRTRGAQQWPTCPNPS
jgi:hypothetical protein